MRSNDNFGLLTTLVIGLSLAFTTLTACEEPVENTESFAQYEVNREIFAIGDQLFVSDQFANFGGTTFLYGCSGGISDRCDWTESHLPMSLVRFDRDIYQVSRFTPHYDRENEEYVTATYLVNCGKSHVAKADATRYDWCQLPSAEDNELIWEHPKLGHRALCFQVTPEWYIVPAPNDACLALAD